MKGSVNFGARTINSVIRPVIEITDAKGAVVVEYICITHAMKTMAEARDFSVAAFRTISGGKKENFTIYPKEGKPG